MWLSYGDLRNNSNGYYIPKGTTIIGNTWAIVRRACWSWLVADLLDRVATFRCFQMVTNFAQGKSDTQSKQKLMSFAVDICLARNAIGSLKRFREVTVLGDLGGKSMFAIQSQPGLMLYQESVYRSALSKSVAAHRYRQSLLGL